jgi:hypothetical protein
MIAKSCKAFASLDFVMDLEGHFRSLIMTVGKFFMYKMHITPFFLLIGDLFYHMREDEVPRCTLLRRTSIGNGTQFFQLFHSCEV